MSEKEPSQHEQAEVEHNQLPINTPDYESVWSVLLWILALYIPTLLLSIVFGVYAQANPNIIDINRWFYDGDVTAVFAIGMALVTLPVLARATKELSYQQKLDFFALGQTASFSGFKPWLIITLIYIFLSVVVNALFEVKTPEWMNDMLASTDNIWLSVLSLCIVAPVFEELVFRGFIYKKIEQTVLRKSGAVFFTALIFTLVHTQYEAIILFDLFVLAMILSIVRLKTDNLKYCIAIHMLNNMVSAYLLYSAT
ncbi:CPBP family intramembrane glutamic endopeptidase [Thalassotalea sp. ND16A]|uniref:CPBP family intramembrane glutamic endopeptidase n=1 Tax=Thalassotalea sp. ND16A TaxID=1535422 RepID=UPI00051A1501|nr:type II CAAX endopeptidase family protein [Thalassotalea sp. ND16A]KGJ87900.1 hypothetical protein ND16A_2814 [Thalassotalea sp. ND16A]